MTYRDVTDRPVLSLYPPPLLPLKKSFYMRGKQRKRSGDVSRISVQKVPLHTVHVCQAVTPHWSCVSTMELVPFQLPKYKQFALLSAIRHVYNLTALACSDLTDYSAPLGLTVWQHYLQNCIVSLAADDVPLRYIVVDKHTTVFEHTATGHLEQHGCILQSR